MAGVEAHSVQRAEAVGEPRLLPAELNEAALEALDHATRSDPIDLDLLRARPIRDLRGRIDDAVATIEKVDHKALLRHVGWLGRLTGADVEARLAFELSTARVAERIQGLVAADDNASHAETLLRDTAAALHRDQERLRAVIAEAHALLAGASAVEAFLRSRFERRLANLEAIHVSNDLALAQIRLAEDVLKAMRDRVRDVTGGLYPLWQRHALAVAVSAAGPQRRTAGEAFAEIHTRLIALLREDADP